MAVDGKIVIGTKVDTSGVTSGVQNVSHLLDGFKGKIATLGIGALLAKEFGAITKATQGFEASMAKASTLFGDVAVDMKNLKDSVLAISAETGSNLDDLGEAIYSAMSAGIQPSEDMGDVLEFVSKSSKLAQAGFTDVDTALSATVKTMNAYGEGIESTDRIMNILLQTQNLGITTVDELGQSLSQVVPTAAAFGVAFEELGASLAVMTASGTSTAMATTQLNSLFAELGKSGTIASKNLSMAAKEAGLSATSFKELEASGYKLPQILELMSVYADKSGSSLLDMFSSIEAGKAALSLTGDQADKFVDALDSMNSATGLVDTAFQKVLKPTERLKNAVTNLRVQIGEKFASSATVSTTKLANFAEKVTGTRTDADDFAEAIDKLIETNKAYQEALETSKEKQDEFTSSLEASTYAAYVNALGTVADTYEKTVKDVANAQEELNGSFSYGLQNRVDNLTRSLSDAAGGADKIVEHYKALVEKDLLGTLTQDERKYLDQFKLRSTLMQEVSQKTEILNEKQSMLDATVRKATEAVRNHVVSLDDLYAISPKLGANVESELKGITRAEAEWKKYEKTKYTETGLAKTVELYTNLAKEAETLEDVTYYTELARLAQEALNEVRGEATDLTAKSTEATDKEADAINASTEALNQNIEARNKYKTSMDEVQKSYEGMLKVNEALGESFYSQEDLLAKLEGDYASLIEGGAKPFSFEMMELYNQIQALEEEIDESEALDKMTQGFQSAGLVIEDIFESVADGEDVWNSFAKAGLNAIAKIVEALGHELAADAVKAIIAKDYGAAAKAGAGSVAAYSAAGLIKGWAGAFATGGVVRGPYTGGDNLSASVKAGETILNHAQTINVARLLDALEQSTKRGGGMVIAFNGPVYGDKEMIATTVYDKIKSLQGEGRLERW